MVANTVAKVGQPGGGWCLAGILHSRRIVGSSFWCKRAIGLYTDPRRRGGMIRRISHNRASSCRGVSQDDRN